MKLDLSKATVLGEIPAGVEPTPAQTPEPLPSSEPGPSSEPEPFSPPAQEQVQAPVAPIQNDFPSEKFNGKYKSWEEVEQVLNKPEPEAPKYDEFLEKLINKYQADGSLEDYFKAYSVDYDSLSDQEMLKRNFFEANKSLSDRAKEKLWEKEISKYTIDPDEFSEDDVELGKELMKRDADKLRFDAKENQKNFLSPQNKAPQLDITKLKEQVEALPEIQKLRADKRISMSVDGQNINYQLDDADFAVNAMVDDTGFYQLFTQNGKLNPEKWTMVVEFARNPDKILKTVLDQGKTLGRSEIESEMKNTRLPGSSQPAGSQNSGDFKSGLLEAFAQAGKTTR